MKYRFNDGKILEAEDAVEFVVKMNVASFAHQTDHRKFMRDCVQRGKLLGLDLDSTNEEEFLISLIRNKVVSPLFPFEGES
ncbi:MAG: hypothetical protein E6R04_11200 [Spirochaetes bacterium]|nr:MAG: hypothetical protein E6R04_11200 [Spirochaetota bacterium]